MVVLIPSAMKSMTSVNNPTYYGIASDLKAIVKLAHAHGMKVEFIAAGKAEKQREKEEKNTYHRSV